MRSEADYFLTGIEDGNLTHEKAAKAADSIDPALLYFIIRYLREKYPPTDPSSSGVLERLVQLTSTHPNIVKKSKEGESDPLVEWFDDTYNMRAYFKDHEQLLDLIIDKIES